MKKIYILLPLLTVSLFVAGCIKKQTIIIPELTKSSIISKPTEFRNDTEIIKIGSTKQNDMIGIKYYTEGYIIFARPMKPCENGVSCKIMPDNILVCENDIIFYAFPDPLPATCLLIFIDDATKFNEHAKYKFFIEAIDHTYSDDRIYQLLEYEMIKSDSSNTNSSYYNKDWDWDSGQNCYDLKSPEQCKEIKWPMSCKSCGCRQATIHNCYECLAEKNNDPSICEYIVLEDIISEDFWQDNCYWRLVIKFRDNNNVDQINFCDKFVESGHKTACYDITK